MELNYSTVLNTCIKDVLCSDSSQSSIKLAGSFSSLCCKLSLSWSPTLDNSDTSPLQTSFNTCSDTFFMSFCHMSICLTLVKFTDRYCRDFFLTFVEVRPIENEISLIFEWVMHTDAEKYFNNNKEIIMSWNASHKFRSAVFVLCVFCYLSIRLWK